MVQGLGQGRRGELGRHPEVGELDPHESPPPPLAGCWSLRAKLCLPGRPKPVQEAGLCCRGTDILEEPVDPGRVGGGEETR